MEELESHDLSVGNEELLARCAKGDQQALKCLFQRHERSVYGLLYRMLASHEDAEEALADVFVKVWRAAVGFRGQASFTTWLYRIASNTARDRLRSRKVRPEVALEDLGLNEAELLMSAEQGFENPEQAVMRAADNACVARAVARLSDEDRLLITLYHLQDRTYEEISEITKISPATLKVKVFRARQKLKSLFLCFYDEQEGKNGLRDNTAESDGVQPRATELL